MFSLSSVIIKSKLKHYARNLGNYVVGLKTRSKSSPLSSYSKKNASREVLYVWSRLSSELFQILVVLFLQTE